MKYSIRFLILLICSIFILSLQAQDIKKFSDDPTVFIDELSAFMGKNISEEDKNNLDYFIGLWRADSIGIFTPEEKLRIIGTCNTLLDRNARTFPHFSDYIQSVTTFKKKQLLPGKYQEWENGLLRLLHADKAVISKVGSYFDFTLHLLDSGYIYKSYSTIWSISNTEFKIDTSENVKVIFGTTDLTCYSKRDSIKIYGTSGIYDPVEHIWKGSSGKITWERAGFSSDSVFAELPAEYVIDITGSEYTAENAVFTNMYFFNKPLKGILVDKVKLIHSPQDATYPRFDSYQKNFKIRNLYQNINYEGGLSMQGSKLVGTGGQSENAKVSVYRHDSLLLTAFSGYFVFKADRINGINTSVIIKLDKDSIFHPGLDFRYIVPSRELTLSRSDKFTSRSPYFDSYHNIDMSFEQLVWKTDESVMQFKAPIGASVGIADFESVNYFNYGEYMSMQGIDEVHPLISIRSFAKKYGSEEFTATDFANYLRMPLHLVKQMLMRMSVAGYVFYDTNTEMAKIKPKLHTTLAASISKIDYDVLNFPSRIRAPLENAVFDLNSFDLTINGIPQIFVSDSQNVMIIPKRERIIMKKNRNFQFDGTVIAGLFKFEGQNFFFDYDSFKINLQNVDRLSINFLTGTYDNYGLPIADRVNSVIQHVTGELLVDEPDNKSGRKSYPEYPIFKSKENSYVFYDRPDIQSGAYDQSEFYFELLPYEMDSLDNFNSKSMRYEGEFVSAGIFPALNQTLSLQKDKSLGFSHVTDSAGLPIYGGKGAFTHQINMSNQGLRGKGIISYLTSQINSDDILFFPDSVNIHATDFTIAKKSSDPGFPMVKSENNYIHWLPYADELYAYKNSVDFTMFNDSTHLEGSLVLSPDGISGSGKMDLKNSELTSDHFTYNSDEIFADTSDFYLKSLHTDGFTVLTDNVKSHIDYRSRKGQFNSNEDYTLVNFPENRYVSFLDNFVWDMDKKELAMGSLKQPQSTDTIQGEEVPVGPTYISVHPKQDSLSFVSPLAFYDYSENLIRATDVKYIDVADARIYPDEGEVIIEQDAKMRTLENAKVLANRLTRYHMFHSSTINVYGRKNYEGIGNYDYIDENEEIQLVHFNKIEVDENEKTHASGVIFEPDEFKLSPYYSYQGKVYLNAEEKYLTFDGAVKIEHACESIEPRWLDFNSQINPLSIYIPVPEQPVDINKAKIYAGLFMHYDSVHIYPAFFTPRKNYSDKNLLPVSGFLYYDKGSQLYKISSMPKLIDRELPGNYLSLHREICELYGEGMLDIGANLGLLKLQTAGNFRHYINSNKTTIDLLLGIDFFFSQNILNIMANELDSLQGLQAVDINRTTYNRAMIEILGKEKTQAFKDELNLFGTVKDIPEPIKHTINFTYLKLEWNDESNSYRSVGKIGIGSIDNIQVNKLVDGLIEIQIKRSGDVCDIYLEADKNTWYYFGYTRGVMQVLSSNKEFVDQIIALKPNERKQKISGKGLGESYIYMVSTDRKKTLFYRRYLDILEERQNKNKEPDR